MSRLALPPLAICVRCINFQRSVLFVFLRLSRLLLTALFPRTPEEKKSPAPPVTLCVAYGFTGVSLSIS